MILILWSEYEVIHKVNYESSYIQCSWTCKSINDETRNAQVCQLTNGCTLGIAQWTITHTGVNAVWNLILSSTKWNWTIFHQFRISTMLWYSYEVLHWIIFKYYLYKLFNVSFWSTNHKYLTKTAENLIISFITKSTHLYMRCAPKQFWISLSRRHQLSNMFIQGVVTVEYKHFSFLWHYVVCQQ